MTEFNAADAWQLKEGLWRPKQEIGDYVEDSGLPVPRRFNDLEEALGHLSTGGAFIIRSDCALEYDGPSGLMDSYVVSSKEIAFYKQYTEIYSHLPINEDEIQAAVARQNSYSQPQDEGPDAFWMSGMIIARIQATDPAATLEAMATMENVLGSMHHYATLIGEVDARAKATPSYSFWEYIPGRNIKVVADSAVAGQYYLFGKYSESGRRSWLVVNSEGVVINGDNQDQVFSGGNISDAIRTYETVRNLPAFNPAHCPVVEMQIDDEDALWFLQYHKTRDFYPHPERLNADDFDVSEGWLAAAGVRGAIAPRKADLILANPPGYGHTLPIEPNHVIGDVYARGSALTEVLCRKLAVCVIPITPERIFDDITASHGLSSEWFKPKASLAFDRRLEPRDLLKSVLLEARQNGTVPTIPVEVVSDGHQGFARVAM